MDDLIALRVVFGDGEARYFLTWGRIHDPVDPGLVEALVRRYVADQSLYGRRRQVESVAVCDSLQEAAGSPYFYEGLFHFAMGEIPFGDGYGGWAERKRQEMDDGGEIFDCGTATQAMAATKSHASLDEWLRRDAIPFDIDAPTSFDAAVDRVIASLGNAVELLGFGEALHGSEEILMLRNRLFQRLGEAHRFSALVIGVTSPQARAMNDYVLGVREPGDQAVQEWFGSGFGLLDANRELLEWMRDYNSDPAHELKLHFYGFDLPLGRGGLANPRLVLDIAVDYLGSVDAEVAQAYRERIQSLAGEAADWERPGAMFDPAQLIGLSERATGLQIATLDLITELRIRRSELVMRTDALSFAEALHHAELGRKLLDAHAALAEASAYARMLGIRDLIMADNLVHYLALERGRGKVLVFSATGHLKRGKAQWSLPPGPEVKEWWPAGSQLAHTLGPRFAVIGQAVGVSEENAIAAPEPGTLEARLAGVGGALFIPTHLGQGMPSEEIAALLLRSGSTLNPTYWVLGPETFSDVDWVVFLLSTRYPRGAPSLTTWNAD